MPLPELDVRAKFTYLYVQLRDGSHLIVKMDPIRMTDLVKFWQETRGQEQRDPLIQIPDPDEDWQDFFIPSSSITYLRPMTADRAEPAIAAEKAERDRIHMENKARKDGLVVAKGGGLPGLPGGKALVTE